MRPRRCLLTGLVALVLGLGTASGQVCGDCDGDGQTTVLDALAAAQHAAGSLLLMTPDREACDVQPMGGDAQVSITDALELARVAVGLALAPTCTLPTEVWRESFNDLATRDAALTDADWGETAPGILRAPRAIAEPELRVSATEFSSLPLRDGGARMQMLFTAAELAGAEGSLVAMQLTVAQDASGGRAYTGLEIRACHTTATELGSVFQANYGGETPALVHAPWDEIYGEALAGDRLDLRLSPGAFTYDGVRNLLIEVIHHGASAPTPLLGETIGGAARRVQSSVATASTGLVSDFAYRARFVFVGGFVPTSVAVSTFYDCMVSLPELGMPSMAASIPQGTAVTLSFQGAPDDGAGQPYLPAASAWINGDPTTLTVFRHLRFRLELQATRLATPEVYEVRVPYDP